MSTSPKPKAAPNLAVPTAPNHSAASKVPAPTYAVAQPLAAPIADAKAQVVTDLNTLKRLEKMNDPSLQKKVAQAIANLRAIPKMKTEAEVKPEKLLGLLARCFLGCGHDVHMLDLEQEIMKHFKKEESLPAGFESSRVLAASLSDDEVGVLVYDKKILVLKADGETREI